MKNYWNSHMLCLNCGKKGHMTKSCHYPTNSYGCVIYKKNNNIIRYLMIQRKYTPEYVDLLRCRYYHMDKSLNYSYLLSLIKEISLIERHYILNYEFNYLWNNLWKWIEPKDQITRIWNEYNECEQLFNRLKTGFEIENYGFVNFQSLFRANTNLKICPEWEFPKGKRYEIENDQQCAIRETCEETSLSPKDFQIYLHVKPYQEVFVGVNSIKYCNSYYVAKLLNVNKCIYYDPAHTLQNYEVRNIGWFTANEIEQLITPHKISRINMLKQIQSLITSIDK